KETTSIQMENEFQSNDSSEAVPQHEVNKTTESQALTTRTGDRERKRPVWQSDYVMESNVAHCLLTEEGEPSTLQEALNNPDASFWKEAMQEEIYMLQPEGFKQKEKENLVCRLNKSLYGLKQAPRCWYKRFDSFIISLGYNRLHVDPCAYFKRFENNDFFILLLYVDDMLAADPNKYRISKLKAQLATEFEMKDIGPANKIIGMQIHRDRLSSKMSSSEKERMEMSGLRYASAVGSLMFAMICTRPDIAHAVGVVSRYMAEPGKKHWEAVKRILRYIKRTSDVALCYGESGLTIKGYVDSDYAGDQDGSKSTTGYVFTLSGETVSWVSKLQSVVAMLTTEAEYVAAAQASKEAESSISFKDKAYTISVSLRS
ncbi:retrovirus-related pol polyprotein from transposon TNT 1-94, partial [Tanacetum coccineum]